MLKINYGTQSVAVTKGSKIRIRSNAAFTVYGQMSNPDGELQSVAIYGPRNVLDRFTTFQFHTDFVLVDTDSSTMWGLEELPRNQKEILDHTPVELTAEQSAPLSLKDEMRRFITEEMSRFGEAQESETFDEADDFDIDDDDADIKSPYELTEMQEEYFDDTPQTPEEPTTPPQKPPSDTSNSSPTPSQPTNPGDPTTPIPPTTEEPK